MAKVDYIEYSIKENYKEQFEYLQKFNLTSHNIQRFEDKISAIITSVDTEIRSSLQHISELQEEVDKQSNKPEMKTLTDDPWYKVYKIQSSVVKYLIRASAFKTWMSKFLILSNNKLSEFLGDINESLVDLKKVELQADMYKQLFEGMKEIKEVQHQQGNFGTTKNYEEQIEILKNQLIGQQESMSGMTEQLQSFMELMDDLKKNQHQAKLDKDEKVDISELNKVPIAIKGDGELVYMDDDDNDDSDDDVTEDPPDDDDDEPIIINTDIHNNLNSKNSGIEFDDFQEEINFFKNITQELGFKEGGQDELLFFLESVEDMERELGVTKEDYDTKEKKINFLGQIAYTYTDFIYNKDVIQDFLGWTKSQLTRYIKKAGVDKKINWDE